MKHETRTVARPEARNTKNTKTKHALKHEMKYDKYTKHEIRNKKHEHETKNETRNMKHDSNRNQNETMQKKCDGENRKRMTMIDKEDDRYSTEKIE